MPINPAIAMGVQPLQLPDPLAQYGKIAAIQQAQNQNALAQYQLAAAQRADVAAENRLNALAAAGADESAVANALLRAGDIKGYAEFEKARSERATQALTREKTKGDILKGQSELIDAKLRQSRAFLDTLDPADPNAPAMYMQWHEANHADPVLGPALAARGITADQSRARIQQAIQQGPQAFTQLLNQSKLGTERFIELNKPTVTQQTLGGTVRAIQTPGLGGAATVVPGSEAAVTMTEAQRLQDQRDRERIRLEGQRVGLEGRRVAIAEENARRESDPAFQQRMAAAKATGEAAAKGDVAAQRALPTVINRAEQGLRLIDELVGKQPTVDKNGKVIEQGTAPHPGFQNAVGTTWLPGARFVPGTDAADFTARFDQLKGASFLEAFESLKGGGAITEKEGAKATDAINRMSLAQSEKEFIAAARDLQEVIRKGVTKAQRQVAAPAAAPTGNVRFLGFEEAK